MRIIRQDPSYMPAGPSSGYALDLLPLGFIPQATYLGNYFAVIPTHWIVWWMVKANVDVLESQACCVRLAILLTTHCGSYQWLSLIAVEGTPLMLAPLDLGSKWFPPMAFINSGWGYSSHATTTGSGSGVDLEVVFFIRAPYLRLTLGFELIDDACRKDEKM